MGWFIHSLNAKQKLIALAAMAMAWAIWANTGAPAIMGAMENAAKPGMAILDQSDPATTAALIDKQNGGLASEDDPQVKPAPKPARTVGSFDDYGEGDFASE